MYNDRHIFEREREEERKFYRYMIVSLHLITKEIGKIKGLSKMKFEIRKKLINLKVLK